jgi:sugar transferase EpsL
MKSLRAKRVFDLTIVILWAPLWVPLLLLVSVLVRIKLGAPVLFRQPRPGYREKIFILLKFRSMTDSMDQKGNLLPDAERLIPFGRWLRATSLDELPELLNVVRGEMSLVGPRPLLVHYLDRYSPDQRRRHQVPPGITGWAQINGRNLLTWDQKFGRDGWYVDHHSLWLDIRILFLTLWQVVMRRGIAAPGDATMPEFRPSDVNHPTFT